MQLQQLSFGFLVCLEEIVVWNGNLERRSDALLGVAGLFFLFLRVRGLVILFGFLRSSILLFFVWSNEWIVIVYVFVNFTDSVWVWGAYEILKDASVFGVTRANLAKFLDIFCEFWFYWNVVWSIFLAIFVIWVKRALVWRIHIDLTRFTLWLACFQILSPEFALPPNVIRIDWQIGWEPQQIAASVSLQLPLQSKIIEFHFFDLLIQSFIFLL